MGQTAKRDCFTETFKVRQSGQFYMRPQHANGLVKGAAMPDWVMFMEKKQNALCMTLCVYNMRAVNT